MNLWFIITIPITMMVVIFFGFLFVLIWKGVDGARWPLLLRFTWWEQGQARHYTGPSEEQRGKGAGNSVLMLTLKDAVGVGVGGQKCPLETDDACIPSIFIKTSQFFFFGERCLISAFTKIQFGKLRMIEIGRRGVWKRSFIFQTSHPSKKIMLSKALSL